MTSCEMANALLPSVSAIILYLLCAFVGYLLISSPLARIPAPHWSCALCDVWVLRARKCGTENRILHDAHKRYGPVIRVGRRTLSVDGIDALRSIYQGGFDKADWYKVFDNYGVPSMFSTVGAKEHSRRKRIISNVFSKSYIHSSVTVQAQSYSILNERLLPLLRVEAAKSDPCTGTEAQSIFMATTMDLISSFVFGLRHGTNFLQDEPYRHHWLQLYLCRHEHHFWPQELPRLTNICTKLGLRLYPAFVDRANEEIGQWNMRMCDATKEELHQSKHIADEPSVFRAMHAGIDKEEELGQTSLLFDTSVKQRDLAIASEVLDHLLAGHESSGIVLTYIAWRLSQSPHVQARLRDELLSTATSWQTCVGHLSGGVNHKALDRLPFLHAVMMETLRLHAPIPGPQPRTTPYPSCQIGGYTVPGGVRIASLAHTLHLDESVFPDANSWNPDRWLEGHSDKDQRGRMSRHFWAFGSGGRMCIGSNFATTAIKSVVAVIYANFATSIISDDGVEQTDGYSARPAKNQLHLRFDALRRCGVLETSSTWQSGN